MYSLIKSLYKKLWSLFVPFLEYMKKISFLLVLSLVLFVFWCWKEKVDITETDFEYDVEICDKYFELVECIIDNDDNPNYSKEMRKELRSQVKRMQEDWKHLSEKELTRKCTEWLAAFETDEMRNNLNSFGCLK